MWPVEQWRKHRAINRVIRAKNEFDRLAPIILGPEWEVVRREGPDKINRWLTEKTGCDMKQEGFEPLVAAMQRMEHTPTSDRTVR